MSKPIAWVMAGLVSLTVGLVIFGAGTAPEESMKVLTQETDVATFAGGCFWCMEPPFEKLPGVIAVRSGYTGGHVEAPTYEEVSQGATGHAEAVRIEFHPDRISYSDLLEVFWRNVDPTDSGGQFVDRGTPYRSGIFFHTDDQRRQAQASLDRLQTSGRFADDIVTSIEPAGAFYPAESYHQDYYKTHPLRYRYYRHASGRDQFLDQAWGEARAYAPGRSTPRDDGVYAKPDDTTLRNTLTPIQYRVTQESGTEAPFQNAYWNNKGPGLYVDVVSGEPLFSSVDKFDSGTGWPSFTRPVADANIVRRVDKGLFMSRTEVRSKHGDSHLGHVFEDGPAPSGLRYCINSAALRFVPLEELEHEGYGEFISRVGNGKDGHNGKEDVSEKQTNTHRDGCVERQGNTEKGEQQ